MKKLLIALLIVTGISSMGCHRVLAHLARRHEVHRSIAGAVVGAVVVGAAVHHATHRRPRRVVVYEQPTYHSGTHCDY